LFRLRECLIFSSSSLGMYFMESIIDEIGIYVNKIHVWSPAFRFASAKLWRQP
jgi:hypothetical protein